MIAGAAGAGGGLLTRKCQLSASALIAITSEHPHSVASRNAGSRNAQAELALAEDFDQIRSAMEKVPPYSAIFTKVRPQTLPLQRIRKPCPCTSQVSLRDCCIAVHLVASSAFISATVQSHTNCVL